MSQLTIPEDIFSTLVVVALISIFAILLGNSLSTAHKAQISDKKTRQLLTASNYLRNEYLSGTNDGPRAKKQAGLENSLSEAIEVLEGKGHRIRIKVLEPRNRVVFSNISKGDEIYPSVSLPFIYENETGRFPAELTILY